MNENTVDNPYVELSEEDVLQKLERARKQANDGKCQDADSMVAEIRAKYGL